MSTIPAQSNLVTDEQAYTVECRFCSAKAGEQCINVRKAVVVSSSRNVLHVQSTFQINWIKTVTE